MEIKTKNKVSYGKTKGRILLIVEKTTKIGENGRLDEKEE